MVHAEAQLDVFRYLHVAGTISEAAFEDARVKALEARVACRYDPAMSAASDDEGEEGVDRLEENAWYTLLILRMRAAIVRALAIKRMTFLKASSAGVLKTMMVVASNFFF